MAVTDEETAEARQAALAQLSRQEEAQQRRIREAVAECEVAMYRRALAYARAEEADAVVGTAVRALTAAGLDPDDITERTGLSAEEIRRHLAGDAVSRQQAIEAGRVPYGDRPATDDGAEQPD